MIHCFEWSTLISHLMPSNCRAASIAAANFKRQLSCPLPTITNAKKLDRFLLPSPLINSVTILESTHFKNSRLDPSFCSQALKVSAELRFLRLGKQLHAHTIKLGLYNKLSLQNQMLHVYVKCKEFDDTEKLFEEMQVRNVVTWNTVICGIVDCRCNFRSYLRRMLLENVTLDHITFNGLLRACVELDDIDFGWQLHCFILKLGFDINCFVSSALVGLYGKFGLLVDARRVFDQVLCRDLVLWNVMVSCYALNFLAIKAFRVFNLMRLEGMKGDYFTFSSLLNSCGTLGSSELGRQIHGLIVKQSFDLDLLVATSLVDMYAKNGNIDDAHKVFDGMAAKNVVSWNTMIVSYRQYGDRREAIRLLRDMLQGSFCPDEITLASILSSCGNLSVTCETMQVHAHVVKKGVQAFLSIGNAFINAYSKCGSIADAFQCFSLVTKPDIVTWTSIIGAYAFHGLPEESIKLFERMLSQGLLNEAWNVLASMPIEPRSDTLAAFMGACKVHGNIGLAKWAAEKLFDLEPSKPVSYALVSNIYAWERCWLDVARLRKMMRDNCDHKVPGCSWM